MRFLLKYGTALCDCGSGLVVTSLTAGKFRKAKPFRQKFVDALFGMYTEALFGM